MKLSISSDQPIAKALLEEIARLCAAHGASWHPQLQLEVKQGAMRVLAPPECHGLIISLPTSLLVPIAGAHWSESAETMQLQQPPQAATEIQKELLQLMVDVYNATNKLNWFNTEHPASLMRSSAVVSAAVERLKPSSNSSAERTSAEKFLATRSFGLKSDPKSEQHQPVLMPLIDLLNHHHKGAPFAISDGAMQAKAAQSGGSECFANYGHRRDALDLALHYGYFDRSTPFAHSAPVEVMVEGIGRLRVERQLQQRPQHSADPPRVIRDEDGLRISHLCCHQFHPERARLMLNLALQGTLQQCGYDAPNAAQLAAKGVKALGEANLQLLSQLTYATETSPHPAAAVLAAAAEHQKSIIADVLQA